MIGPHLPLLMLWVSIYWKIARQKWIRWTHRTQEVVCTKVRSYTKSSPNMGGRQESRYGKPAMVVTNQQRMQLQLSLECKEIFGYRHNENESCLKRTRYVPWRPSLALQIQKVIPGHKSFHKLKTQGSLVGHVGIFLVFVYVHTKLVIRKDQHWRCLYESSPTRKPAQNDNNTSHRARIIPRVTDTTSLVWDNAPIRSRTKIGIGHR